MLKKDKHETPGDTEYKKGTVLLVTVFGLGAKKTYMLAILKILNMDPAKT